MKRNEKKEKKEKKEMAHTLRHAVGHGLAGIFQQKIPEKRGVETSRDLEKTELSISHSFHLGPPSASFRLNFKNLT